MLVLPFKSGQNKGNVKFEPDVSKSTEYRKKYIYIKKEKIMNRRKPKLSGRLSVFPPPHMTG